MSEIINIDSLRNAAMLSSEAPLESAPTAKVPAEPIVDDSPLTIDGIAFPYEASRRIKAMSPEERATWDAERYKAKVNPIFLANDVLGMELQPIHQCLFQNLFPKFQPGKSLASLDPIFKKRMVLWSRDLGKSSSSRVLGTQLVLNYPNIRILMMTGSDALAQRQLAAVKRVFAQPTQKFQELFPEYCWISKQDRKTGEWHDVEPDFGNAHEFSVPCRTDRVATEKTFTISTARSVNSGSHFEILFVDDLLNDSNWQSASAQEKVYEDYRSICPLLEPSGYLIMTGTYYVVNDTYKKIQANAAEAGALSQWKFSVEDCWDYGCRSCNHGAVWHDKNENVLGGACIHDACSCAQFQSDDVKDVVFPQFIKKSGEPWGYTADYLARIEKDQGRRFYSCQYLLAPEQDGTQVFTQALLGQQTLHQREQLERMAPRDAGENFICGDLAFSVSPDRDESVIFVFKKYAGALFVWGCVYGRWTPSERIGKILQLIKDVRPVKAYFERTLNSDSMQLALEAKMSDFSLARLPIEWIDFSSNRKDAKVQRIESVEGVLASGRLWLCGWMDGYSKLEKQLMEHPNSQHDDFSDALSMCTQCPTNYLREQTAAQYEKQNSDNWLRKLSTPSKDSGGYPDCGMGNGLCG